MAFHFPFRLAVTAALSVRVHARGVTTTVAYDIREPTRRQAKNVVLLIGDGMSLPLMTAARLVSRGMYQGKYKDTLHMQALDHVALVSTSGIEGPSWWRWPRHFGESGPRQPQRIAAGRCCQCRLPTGLAARGEGAILCGRVRSRSAQPGRFRL